jgi:hypothetical protein
VGAYSSSLTKTGYAQGTPSTKPTVAPVVAVLVRQEVVVVATQA